MSEPTKVYAFAAWVPAASANGARAILDDGTIVAEAVGPVEQVKQDIVIAVQLSRPKARIVWVDAPRMHPEIRHVMDRFDRELATPEEDEEASEAAVLRAMKQLHDEHHLCPTCSHFSICKIAAAVETAPDALVTISACLKHTTENHDDRQREEGTDG